MPSIRMSNKITDRAVDNGWLTLSDWEENDELGPEGTWRFPVSRVIAVNEGGEKTNQEPTLLIIVDVPQQGGLHFNLTFPYQDEEIGSLEAASRSYQDAQESAEFITRYQQGASA